MVLQFLKLKKLLNSIKLSRVKLRNRIASVLISIGAYNDDETVMVNNFPYIVEGGDVRSL